MKRLAYLITLPLALLAFGLMILGFGFEILGEHISEWGKRLLQRLVQ